MSREEARKLPRYALLALLALFIFCGLWARELWTLRDAESFGIAATMASGSLTDWLLPNVFGRAAPAAGPLAGWVSAVFILIFSPWVGDVQAYRLASVFWFTGTACAIWYGAWSIARRREAQPVAFAFGGEASPRDYSRVVADSAVLLFVATFGIATRQHEAVPAIVLLSMAALNFFGLARALRNPISGTVTAGLAASLAALGSTIFAGVWLLAASLIVNVCVRSYPGNRDRRILLLLVSALTPISIWALAAWFLLPEGKVVEWFLAWTHLQAADFGIFDLRTLEWLLKNFVWYLCPIWPLVVWGLFSWRRQLDRTHLFLPLMLSATGILSALFSSMESADMVFLACIPSLSVFAAFSLITLRRAQENLLDWFSLSVFSLAAATLWLYWFAWLVGIPPKMAASIEMLAPGVRPLTDSGLALGVVVTALWVVFVVWRTTHRPIVAWRGPWLAAAGLTLVASLLFGLFHTAIDRARSYETVAVEVAEELRRLGLEPDERVEDKNLPLGIRAVLVHYGHVPFSRTPTEACRFAVMRDRSGPLPNNAIGSPIARPHTDEVILLVPGRASEHRRPVFPLAFPSK